MDSGIYKCGLCEYMYRPQNGNPENGIAPGTPFDGLPDDCICPRCGNPKTYFYSTDDE